MVFKKIKDIFLGETSEIDYVNEFIEAANTETWEAKLIEWVGLSVIFVLIMAAAFSLKEMGWLIAVVLTVIIMTIVSLFAYSISKISLDKSEIW